jgi:HK97 family phage prohead protease/HK97 family phage major capsid protein
MSKKHIIHLASQFKAVKTETGDVKISGYASTNDKDRAGDIIAADAWTKGGLDNYKNNPIILFNHDYHKPIGKATIIEVDEKGLKIEAIISPAAADVRSLVEDEVLKSFSVGFQIKDADYKSEIDTFIIKDVELYEISIVSVPCNQAATFSLSKTFNSDSEFQEFKQNFVDTVEHPAEDSAKAQKTADKSTEGGSIPQSEEKKMTPEELKAMAKAVAEETARAMSTAAAKEAADAAAKKAADEAANKDFTIRVESAAEKLMADIETRFSEKSESLESIMGELKSELAEKSAEIQAMRESKRVFTDRGSEGTWKEKFASEAIDAFILGNAIGKGWDTKFTQDLIQKVNTHSGVDVSSADFEQIVSTNIERDIELELVLAPLFREIPMTSATMILPIMPDSGYAEFVSSGAAYANRNGVQTAPHGNLDQRSATYGDNAGAALNERILQTHKLMSTSYLGNETEEDAIMPLLGLLRDAMVRSHARSMEQALLVGNHADGVYGSESFAGLISLADSDNHETTASGTLANFALTAADLFDLRKNMGKYGRRPEDVVYIVSLEGYYNLIEDAEFQDLNIVGNSATKLRGEIGSVYGSRVLVCDEFAPKAVDKFTAIAVNTRNFLMPRLRGLRLESEYVVAEQRRVLVASQRIGFTDIIDGAANKWALKLPAS